MTQPAYIGAVANQKNVTKFKIGWMGYRPMDEWVIVEGMHEPIIDRQTWDIVQEKINSRERPDGNGNFSIFSGLVHCADCGKTLTVRYNSQRRKLFSCLTYNRYGKSHCTSHSIFYDQLYDAVLKDIQDCAALALADEDAAVAALCSLGTGSLLSGYVSSLLLHDSGVAPLESLQVEALPPEQTLFVLLLGCAVIAIALAVSCAAVLAKSPKSILSSMR